MEVDESVLEGGRVSGGAVQPEAGAETQPAVVGGDDDVPMTATEADLPDVAGATAEAKAREAAAPRRGPGRRRKANAVDEPEWKPGRGNGGDDESGESESPSESESDSESDSYSDGDELSDRGRRPKRAKAAPVPQLTPEQAAALRASQKRQEALDEMRNWFRHAAEEIISLGFGVECSVEDLYATFVHDLGVKPDVALQYSQLVYDTDPRLRHRVVSETMSKHYLETQNRTVSLKQVGVHGNPQPVRRARRTPARPRASARSSAAAMAANAAAVAAAAAAAAAAAPATETAAPASASASVRSSSPAPSSPSAGQPAGEVLSAAETLAAPAHGPNGQVAASNLESAAETPAAETQQS